MPMTRRHAVHTALAVVLLSGFAQGVWSGRWRLSHELEEAVARIGGIPAAFGDWEGRAVELDRAQLEQAEAKGHLSLVCGRPGPISVHTPDVCYPGAGFVAAGPPVGERLGLTSPARVAEFNSAKFIKRGAASSIALRVFWAWDGEGAWRAPNNPRLNFARFKALYKLYVIHETTSSDRGRDAAICRGFLEHFVPELDKALFPTSPAAP